MAAAGGDGPGRERLELEAFETEGADFDASAWLNARLARSGVSFDRLDQHLQSLGMSCQLLCQDASESIEVAANELVTRLPSSSRELERMRQDVLRGRSRLGAVLEGVQDSGNKEGSEKFKSLSDVDCVKQRVEMACSALRETGSWDRKINDCRQLVRGGGLSDANTQLASLKQVLDAFRMLPEYTKKETQLQELELNLLKEARSRMKSAFDRGASAELRSCHEVFGCLQMPKEPAAIASSVFVELAEKAWQKQGVRDTTSASDLAAAAKAVLEAVAHALEEKWPLVVELAAAAAGADEARQATAAKASTMAATAVRSSLSVLSREVDARLLAEDAAAPPPGEGGEEADDMASMARGSRSMALLAAYVDGFEIFEQRAPMASEPSLWPEVCRDADGSEVLPWALLREVTRFIVFQPIQDDAMSMVPPVSGQMRPSEAVLAAESNAKKLLQMPASWARRLETQGASQLAVIWLACVDEACASYWRSWDKLIGVFQNTLQQKLNAGVEASFDSAMLNECMQLHSMLHDSLPQHFSMFQVESLQLAARMRAAEETAFGRAMVEKLRNPDEWCDRLAVPSPDSLRSAHGALDGAHPESAVLAARAGQALASSAVALAEAEKKAGALVTRCCVQPVTAILNCYHEMPEWNQAADPAGGPPLVGGLLPLQQITSVGEHLFTLMSQLERSQDGSQLQWLPTVLRSVAEAVMHKALQIKHLSAPGAQQLQVDLEYVQKVVDALGQGSDGSSATGDVIGAVVIELKDFVEALSFLSAQLQRKQACAAKGEGESFTEETREGPPLNRRFERLLRIAMAV